MIAFYGWITLAIALLCFGISVRTRKPMLPLYQRILVVILSLTWTFLLYTKLGLERGLELWTGFSLLAMFYPVWVYARYARKPMEIAQLMEHQNERLRAKYKIRPPD